jgi:hypothetical protein
MQLQDVEVIATRTLQIEVPDGSTRNITVRIGRPQAFPDPPDDWFVPYEIIGIPAGLAERAHITKSRVGYAGGVDTIQALQLVMIIIGAELTALKRESGGAIRWEGGNDGDLGFPIPTTSMPDNN